MKFKSQPHRVDNSYKLDDLKWINPELKLTFSAAITNDPSLEGKIGGSSGTDWSKGIFASDEWGEGFFAEYGFQRKYGWFTDSFLYSGASRLDTNLNMDAFYCTNSDKSCTIEFSRDINVFPTIIPGEEYYIVTASSLSTAPSAWLVSAYKPVTVG